MNYWHGDIAYIPINLKPYKNVRLELYATKDIEPTQPLFKTEQILFFDDLFKYEVGIFMYRFMHNMQPKSFDNFGILNVNYRQRSTRQNFLLHEGRPRTNFSKRLPNHLFIRMWNNLPSALRDIPNYRTFRLQYKQNLIEDYSNIVQCENRHCRDCF